MLFLTQNRNHRQELSKHFLRCYIIHSVSFVTNRIVPTPVNPLTETLSDKAIRPRFRNWSGAFLTQSSTPVNTLLVASQTRPDASQTNLGRWSCHVIFIQKTQLVHKTSCHDTRCDDDHRLLKCCWWCLTVWWFLWCSEQGHIMWNIGRNLPCLMTVNWGKVPHVVWEAKTKRKRWMKSETWLYILERPIFWNDLFIKRSELSICSIKSFYTVFHP